jgi:4-amino-4-deoxy-L-arabinose transferase-like glycosyltransferase
MQDLSRAPATPSNPIDRPELAAVAVITALGALCRLTALRQPMRYDEAVAWVGFIGRSWWTILSQYPTPNNHVFFSLLAKATSSLAPYEPWAIRLPALLPGIAIVPATWAVGRRLADRSTALLGAALAAGSMPLVLYSTNARGHSLVVLGGLALVLLGDRLRTRVDSFVASGSPCCSG